MKRIMLLVLLLLPMIMPTIALGADEGSYLKINLLNQDPDPAKPGDYVELRWKVEKIGRNPLSGISFDLETEYPFSFDSSDTKIKSIGSWTGYSNDENYYTLYYKVLVAEDAIKDTYELNLVARFNDGIVQRKTFEIRVDEKKTSSFVVGQLITSPIKLYADTDENRLDVTIENIGDDDAQVVVAELDLPDGFEESYGYSTRANLGTIKEGQNKVATYYVNIDKLVKEGTVDAKLRISFKDNGDEDNVYETVTLPLEIPVSGKPSFEFSNFRFDKDISVGNTVAMTVNVTNVGSREAESVSLRAFKESSQPFDFIDKSDFVGKLSPGQSGEAILTFTVQDGDVKEYLVDLQARGIYNDEVMTDDGVAAITLIPSNRGFSVFDFSIPAVVALVLLIIVAYVAYKYGRSRQRKR